MKKDKKKKYPEHDYFDGTTIPDLDVLDGHMGIREWHVWWWREYYLGIEGNLDVLNFAIDHSMGDNYLIGTHDALPSGAERSWKRGTWANIPTSWIHRDIDLKVEFYQKGNHS